MTIDEIRERWAGIGPWIHRGVSGPDGSESAVHDKEEPGCLVAELSPHHPEQGALAVAITNAPTDVAFLLAEVERLTAERDDARRMHDARSDAVVIANAHGYDFT